MALAFPAIYSGKAITRIGLVDESFFLVTKVSCEASVEKTVDRGSEGEEIDIAVGGAHATWRVEGKVLSQQGAADTYPGTIIAPGALQCLSRPRFGISPADGVLIFMGGTFTEEPGQLATVAFTIDQHFIQFSAGSPDNEGTDTINGGTLTGDRAPAFTDASSEIELEIGVEAEATIGLSGTDPITLSVATGFALPNGVTLTGDALSGIPTEDAVSKWVELVASNAVGSTRRIFKFTVNGQIEPPVTYGQFYLLYVHDFGGDRIEWECEYKAYAPPPADMDELLEQISIAKGYEFKTGQKHPLPGGGTIELCEVWSIQAGAYWYRRDETNDQYIAGVLGAGKDPVTELTGVTPHNGVVITGGWAGPKKPSSIRIGQYYILRCYQDVGALKAGQRWIEWITRSFTPFDNLEDTVNALSDGDAPIGAYIGGMAPYDSGEGDQTEVEGYYFCIDEIVDADGTSRYLRSGRTAVIKPLLDSDVSPITYLPTMGLNIQFGVRSQKLFNYWFETPPTWDGPDGAPGAEIGTEITGASPAPTYLWYVMSRDAVTGEYWCQGYGIRYFPGALDTRVTNWWEGSGGAIEKAKQHFSFAWQEFSSNDRIITEIYKKGISSANESGDGYYYQRTPSDNKIERCISWWVSPVGNAAGGKYGGLFE